MPDDYYVSQYSGEEIDDAIARALPGGAIDITLQNKGDTGFGFNGDLNIIVHWDDTDGTKFESSVDTILLGMSRDISKRLKIVDYPACVVDGNGGYADIYSRDDKGNNASCTIAHYAVWSGGKIVIALKQKTDGVWYPWEYLNPPMELGEEYRTTERYLGRPVYKKLLSFTGAMTEGYSDMHHNIANIAAIVGCYAELFAGSSSLSTPILDGNNMIIFSAGVNSICKTSVGNYSAYSARVLMSYTKTTD